MQQPTPTVTPSEQPNGSSATDGQNSGAVTAASTSVTPAAEKPVPSYGRAGGRAAIPAWQLAAAKKNEEAAAKKDTSESGTLAGASTSS